MEFAVGGADMAAVPPAPRRGARVPRRRPPRARMAQGRRRARHRLPRRDHRRRHVGPARRRTGCSRPGVPFVILEKNDDVGGTWLENTYPGLPGRQPEPQLQLLVRAAPRLAAALLDPGRAARLLPPLRRRVRPARRTSGSAPRCVGRRGPRADQRWTRRTSRTADGREEIARRERGRSARSVSSTGRCSPTSRVAIRSPARRSTRPRWDHDVDLHGKRVAVIGTGASAVQFIPEIAPRVGELARVPAHAAVARPDARLPRRGRRPGCGGSTRTCRRTASGTGSGSSGGWATACSPGVRVDPDWEPKDRLGQRRSTTSCACCSPCTSTTQFADRPDLLEQGRARPIRPAPSGCCATTACGPARSSATTCSS